jgi:glycosyltransferase involved in cell wall biosynthesis
MRIAIATTQVPFIHGGAEVMTKGLCDALALAGHDVEIVTIPFRFSPPSQVFANMDYWQSQNFDGFDCGAIDEVIALTFPAYYLNHKNKIIWLMHQHRSVYELYDTPYGEASGNPESALLHDKVRSLDTSSMSSAKAVYTISKTVSNRLNAFNGVSSVPLYQPPPHANKFMPGEIYPYIFCPSRLEALKRQDLLIRAMQLVKEPVFAVIAGQGGMQQAYVDLANSLGLSHRIKFVGRIDDVAMRRYYSNSLAVFFGPYAEDYGFVTLEAMLSAKPVITCTDSGGPTEFISDGETGYVVSPEPSAIANAINSGWLDRGMSLEMGNNARAHYQALGISWGNVVDTLIGGGGHEYSNRCP